MKITARTVGPTITAATTRMMTPATIKPLVDVIPKNLDYKTNFPLTICRKLRSPYEVFAGSLWSYPRVRIRFTSEAECYIKQY